jgi:hypothetical protein
MGVFLFHPIDLVAADETNPVKAIGCECIDGPVQEPLALDFGKTLRGIGGGRHESPATPGADYDDTHAMPSRAEKLSGAI